MFRFFKYILLKITSSLSNCCTQAGIGFGHRFLGGKSALERSKGIFLQGSRKPDWNGFGHCNLSEPIITEIGNYDNLVPKPYSELVKEGAQLLPSVFKMLTFSSAV